MEMDSILTIISTLGFPIVAYLLMFWKMNKQDDDHKEEMKSMTAALENNTVALTKLIEKLDDNQ